MSTSIDQILEEAGITPIVSLKDTRLIQLVNLKLVSIQIVGINKYNTQEITLGTRSNVYEDLDLDALVHRIKVLSITEKDGSFSKKWHVEDVRIVREGISEVLAEKILIHAIDTHDSNIGINWEVLEECAQYVLREMV